MNEFLSDHWGSIAVAAGVVFSTFCAACAWIGKSLYTWLQWVGTDVIKPLINAHIEFMQKTIIEQKMQSDILAGNADKLHKMVGELERLSEQLESTCKYDGGQKKKEGKS